jgi:hypothetical protein
MSGITATSSTSVTKTVKLCCVGFITSPIVLLSRINTPGKQIILLFVLLCKCSLYLFFSVITKNCTTIAARNELNNASPFVFAH